MSKCLISKIRELEAEQRSYTAKINCSRLLGEIEALRMYFLDRRRERYLIIHVDKILQSVSPSFQSEKCMGIS